MQYCITKEEVDWIIKDWPVQWQLPVTKSTTRIVTTQSSRPKDKAEAGSSARTSSPTDNTRMTTMHRINQPGAAQYQNDQGEQQQQQGQEANHRPGKEGYFTGWRRKNPGYNKWGATLTDSKEARTGKRGVQEKEI
jgi:hypothetical protein